jgi:hypothetical protein
MLDPLARTNPMDSRESNEPAHAADPLADLLLSAAAFIIIAVIAVLPILPRHSMPQRDLSRASQNVVFRLGDREVEPFIATERGLIVGRSSPRMIPVDKIFFDQALPGILEEMRKADDAVIVLIEPNGLETAFQLEAVASRHGPARMRQVRIDSECHFARMERVASYCGDLLRRLRGGHS